MSSESRSEETTSNVPPNSSDSEIESDFEAAIAACGFGCFNICLIIASMTTAISVVNTATSLSYILPVAELDLKLSLMDKGYLNAVSFAGMIFSAIPWGYIADTMGRKIVMVYALLLDGIIVMFCGISQTFSQLLILKFFDGFLICGPFAVVMSYVSEFHGLRRRGQILMIIGMNFAAAATVLPLLAICILPYQLVFEYFGLRFKNWHVFLLTTAIVPFFGGILNLLFPESPKFLMSQGRNDKALDCLRTIYAINHRKPKSTYPITNLVDEDPVKTERYSIRNSVAYKATHNTMADKRQLAAEQFIEGLQQLRPLFSSPYLKPSVQVYSIFFCIQSSLNSIRLWLPQVFVTLEELERKQFGDKAMCTVLEYNYNKTILLEFDNSTSSFNYDLEHISASSFIDNLIVAIASFIFHLLTIFVINKVASNLVLEISLCLAFFSGMILYFSNSHLMTLLLASIYIGVSCVAATTVIYNSVNLFPTQMRTMVIIMMMTFGRFGSLLGSIIFPFLISLGCIPPFLQIGGVFTVAFILSLFLPNTTNTALK